MSGMERSQFARMSTKDFLDHLEDHGIAPTETELNSRPQGNTPLHEGIEVSILEGTGQRFGEPGGAAGDHVPAK